MADDFFADLLPMKPKANGARDESSKEDSRNMDESFRGNDFRTRDAKQRQTQEVGSSSP